MNNHTSLLELGSCFARSSGQFSGVIISLSGSLTVYRNMVRFGRSSIVLCVQHACSLSVLFLIKFKCFEEMLTLFLSQ